MDAEPVWIATSYHQNMDAEAVWIATSYHQNIDAEPAKFTSSWEDLIMPTLMIPRPVILQFHFDTASVSLIGQVVSWLIS